MNQIEQRITAALEALEIQELRHREISTLSGGQKQKVAIAAILALEPDILVLDEPTGELDPASSVQIFKLLQKLNKEKGITIVVAEQKIMLLCEYVKKLIVLEKEHSSTTEKSAVLLPIRKKWKKPESTVQEFSPLQAEWQKKVLFQIHTQKKTAFALTQKNVQIL